MNSIKDIQIKLAPYRDQLTNHPLYKELENIDDIKELYGNSCICCMGFHVSY